jgi:hypothetical protein
MIITLNEDEAMICKHLANLRVAELQSEDPEMITDNLKNGGVHGSRFALCKALNIFPDLSVSNERALIGRTGAKIRMIYHPEILPLYPIDGIHDVYIVMTGVFPVFDLAGYVLKESAKGSKGWLLRNMYKFTEDMVCMEFLK